MGKSRLAAAILIVTISSTAFARSEQSNASGGGKTGHSSNFCPPSIPMPVLRFGEIAPNFVFEYSCWMR